MDDPAHLLLRFAHYAVLLGLFGLSAFRVIGLRRVSLPDAQARTFQMVVIAAPMLSAALFLVSIATMMGQQVFDVDRSVVEAMLLTTDMGWAFIVRCALLMLAITPILLSARWRYGRAIAALFYAGALSTLPWSGHAAAATGDLGVLHRLNDGLHLLAAGYWIGAIGWFVLLAIRAHRCTESVSPQQLLTAMHRFRPGGLALVAVVALTGVLNAQLIFGIGNTAVLDTAYGQLLVAKIALFAVMLGFASRHATLARQREVADGQVLARIRRSLVGELATAVAAIGVVTTLGVLSPMP